MNVVQHCNIITSRNCNKNMSVYVAVIFKGCAVKCLAVRREVFKIKNDGRTLNDNIYLLIQRYRFKKKYIT